MFFLLPTITFTGLLIKQLPCIHLHSPSLSIFRYFWVFFITRIPIAHMSYRRFSDQSPPYLRQRPITTSTQYLNIWHTYLFIWNKLMRWFKFRIGAYYSCLMKQYRVTVLCLTDQRKIFNCNWTNVLDATNFFFIKITRIKFWKINNILNNTALRLRSSIL